MSNLEEQSKKITGRKWSSVTLGELLEIVSFRPEDVEKLQLYLIDEGFTHLCLEQNEVPESLQVWDGVIAWNPDTRTFRYEGANGPGGFAVQGVSLPLTTSSVFDIC
jgi:hypothetical protein|tara:strand:+ start:3325 stop:3645 length:321 start_codon:yes stop_codon:yes gene_type:complete